MAEPSHIVADAQSGPAQEPVLSRSVTASLAVGVIAPALLAVLTQQAGWAALALLALVGLLVYGSRSLRALRRSLTDRERQLARLQEQLALVKQSAQIVSFTLDQTIAMQTVCETALKISGAQAAAIWVLNAQDGCAHLRCALGLSEDQQQIWRVLPFSEQAMFAGTQVVSDARIDDGELARQARQMGFGALIRFGLNSGKADLGLMLIGCEAPRQFSADEINLLEMVASQIAAFIDDTDLFEVLEGYAQEMAQLVHLSRISMSNLHLEAVVEDILGVLRQMAPSRQVLLGLFEEKTPVLRFLGVSPDDDLPQTLIVTAVPELQAVAEDSLPRPRAFQIDDVQLSAGMNDLLLRLGATALAVFPMFCNGVPLGVVLMGAPTSDALYDRAWQTLEMAANQIAAHVQNALLYTNMQHSLDQRLDQLSLIETIARQMSITLDVDAIVRAGLEAALRAAQADVATLALLTEADDLWTILQYDGQGEVRRAYRSRGRDDGILGQVVATHEAVLVADTRDAEQTLLPGPKTSLSALAVPLVREQAVIGALLVESSEVDSFTPEQADFLKNLADHAVISIENARLLEERQYQINTLRALQSMALRLSSEIDTTSVARVVLETARDLFDAHEVALFRYDGMGSQLTALLALRDQKFSRWASVEFITASAALQAAQTDEIQVTRQMLNDDLAEESHGRREPYTLISVPIKRGGDVHEVLSIAFIEQRSLQKRDLTTVALLASQAAGHLENAVLHARIRVGSERMRAILNTTRDGVLLLDRDGRLVECNPSAERLLGIDREEFIGRHFVSMLMSTRHADDLEGIGYSRAQLTELARQLRLEPERISRRQFSRVSAGQTIHVEEIGSPVVDEENRIVARLLVLRDITEQKVLNDYRDDITHMAVHDLRGPLAAIISGLSIVMEDLNAVEDIDPADSEILRVSLDSANTLLELVESMLDIARMESRQMPVNRALVPVSELIQSAMSMLQNSAQLADIDLKVLIEDDLAPLDVDPHLIRRVLINLIDNALRHTPDGSAVHITARMSDQPGRIVMAVADSGPGIPPTERERIFERFRQARDRIPVRGGKGNGLGLTFCRLAVEAHGGRIWVEPNSPLPGACFAFTLPAAAASVPTASTRA